MSICVDNEISGAVADFGFLSYYKPLICNLLQNCPTTLTVLVPSILTEKMCESCSENTNKNQFNPTYKLIFNIFFTIHCTHTY